MERKKKEDTTYGKNESIMNKLLQLEEDEKYEKELRECNEWEGISRGCKDYLKRKYKSDYDKLHTSDTYMDTYMGPIE